MPERWNQRYSATLALPNVSYGLQKTLTYSPHLVLV